MEPIGSQDHRNGSLSLQALISRPLGEGVAALENGGSLIGKGEVKLESSNCSSGKKLFLEG